MMIRAILAAVGLAAAIQGTAFAETIFGGEVNIRNAERDDRLSIIAGEVNASGRFGSLNVTGGELNIDAFIARDGDFIGGAVTIRGSVGRNLSAVGGELDVDAAVQGDLSLAGGVLRIRGATAGDVNAGGAMVNLGREAAVGGDFEAAGENVTIAGDVAGNARIRAEQVTVSGRVRGRLDVTAQHLVIADGAVIEGGLRHRGPSRPDIAPGAQVTGEVDYAFADFERRFRPFRDMKIRPWPSVSGVGPAMGVLIVGAALLLGFFAAAIMPKGVSRLTREFRRRPFVSTMIGFLIGAFSWLILVAGIVLLAITVVGALLIPFWVLFCVFVLLLAYPLGAIAVGDFILNRGGKRDLGLGLRTLSMLIVLVLAAALWVVPVLGVTAWMLLSWVGLGAWIFALGKSEREHTAIAAA